MHALTHTRVCIRTCAHACAKICSHLHTCAYTCVSMHVCAYTHVCTRTQDMCAHVYAHPHTCMHLHTPHAHTHVRPCTHMHTHVYSHVHTYAHTCAHTFPPPQWWLTCLHLIPGAGSSMPVDASCSLCLMPATPTLPPKPRKSSRSTGPPKDFGPTPSPQGCCSSRAVPQGQTPMVRTWAEGTLDPGVGGWQRGS